MKNTARDKTLRLMRRVLIEIPPLLLGRVCQRRVAARGLLVAGLDLQFLEIEIQKDSLANKRP